MKISMDVGEMGSVRARLTEARELISAVNTPMPSSTEFGAAVLGGAAASFHAAMERRARALSERLSQFDEAISLAASDMATLEDNIVAGLAQYEERLG